MQVLQAYKPFEIQEIELDAWQQRPVKNNFFEFVLIKEGAGMQCINYNEYSYEKGSMFLLPPLKCHSFRIDHPSRFVFLKFTSDFFRAGSREAVNQQEWFREAAYILSNYNQLPGDIIQGDLDRQHVFTLIDLILKENRNHGIGSVNLIKSLMTSILEILLRNIKQGDQYEVAIAQEQDDRITKLLTYINEHLSEPQLLKVDQLAKEFLLSPTYVSEFFRKKVNMSLREYIIRAKLKQVEIRLLNSDYRLVEIADELKFTDVSHLSKTFKRYSGMSIREFKQGGEYRLLKRSTC
ncbi:helix-turn-helix domain-containing protein [Flavilitoribacter nigricans]|uniref:AraC family transcriptional regulator n=1 Tax=Flavilitoribacter nigricans (strain ATCC 23147 / DSM 23189 / NBRC 102662 / NCIMB 1420 / SS-2) TaxID=1122177 RepID=A0A2D0N3M7_FLAN2|nr:AraC family transcriptional regulator [Flavilitoribacter nigricans]PHN02749.1 AraC family transcriptional regulator [Flavilitoribacter nigricans DSM 23189 = NBRC 102662]